MLTVDSLATLTRPPSKFACLEAALGAAVRTWVRAGLNSVRKK